jgi:hypothetical protein
MGFKLGQTVYLKTDAEQDEHIIVSRREVIGGTVIFTIGSNGNYFDVYDIEITTEIDPLKKLGVTAKEN